MKSPLKRPKGKLLCEASTKARQVGQIYTGLFVTSFMGDPLSIQISPSGFYSIFVRHCYIYYLDLKSDNSGNVDNS